MLGALTVGGDGIGGDDSSQAPGIILSALVLVAGYVLLARQPAGGPLATAGTVAAALAVPPLLFFLTFDENDFPPYSTDVILLLSTAAWAVSYLVGPGRGRPFFLGAACIGLWMSLLQVTEGVFDLPFDLIGAFAPFDPTFDDSSGFGFDAPDPATIGGLSLLLGAAYLLVARAADRRGHVGFATPLTVAALVVLPVGVAFLGDELEAVGAGLLGTAVGVAVAAHGASVGRRATTWIGAAGAALGLLVVVGDLVDEATPGGIALMLVGAGVVIAAEALRQATGEPDEVEVHHPLPPA